MVKIITSGLFNDLSLTSLPAAVVYLDYAGAVPLRGGICVGITTT